MLRYVVDTAGYYYDTYHSMSDFVTIHLDVLNTDIQTYEHEALLAIL